MKFSTYQFSAVCASGQTSPAAESAARRAAPPCCFFFSPSSPPRQLDISTRYPPPLPLLHLHRRAAAKLARAGRRRRSPPQLLAAARPPRPPPDSLSLSLVIIKAQRLRPAFSSLPSPSRCPLKRQAAVSSNWTPFLRMCRSRLVERGRFMAALRRLLGSRRLCAPRQRRRSGSRPAACSARRDVSVRGAVRVSIGEPKSPPHFRFNQSTTRIIIFCSSARTPTLTFATNCSLEPFIIISLSAAPSSSSNERTPRPLTMEA